MGRANQLRIVDCGLRIGGDCAIRSGNPKSERSLSAAAGNPKSRRGLTLIEVVASTMIVGLMAVAALNALGAATKSANSIGNRAVAAGMADELMSEILMQPYSDPDGSSVFGHESGESVTTRSAFDDVDDYNGWNASPPQYRDGTTIPDRATWKQRVGVSRVVPANPSQTTGTDQGAKQIHVTIEYENQVLADQIAVRTDTDDK
jgi:prepilin-type N-terminal cleavage/methylation domain-containing protein